MKEKKKILIKILIRTAFDFLLMLLLTFLLIYMLGSLGGCVSPRSSPIFSIPYEDQASRGIVKYNCNGEIELSQGLAVCEEKSPARAVFNVKVPPLPGRVIFSNGLIKSVTDFNNYGEEGFWFWKKKKIQDTWINLDLKEFADFGDYPVVISTVGKSDKIGVIQSSVVFYGRICDEVNVPCSSLEVSYDCVGHIKKTGVNKIGKCQRLAKSSQSIKVSTTQSTSGGKIYLSMPQAGVLESKTITAELISRGWIDFQIDSIPLGPSLMGIREVYYAGNKLVSKEARILFLGIDPKWTGNDKPSFIREGDKFRVLKPFASDMIEASLFNGEALIKKWISYDAALKGVDAPVESQKLCAFSYSRDSSDLQYQCINQKGEEVEL